MASASVGGPTSFVPRHARMGLDGMVGNPQPVPSKSGRARHDGIVGHRSNDLGVGAGNS